MNKITLSLAVLATMAFVAIDSNTAQAAHGFRGFGLHFGGRNVHLDIGNPHGNHHGYHHRSNVVYRTSRNYHPGHRARYHYDWHDTSHFDYIPGGYVRHGNHLDYVPGRYVYHQEGHYDKHRGSHHGRHH